MVHGFNRGVCRDRADAQRHDPDHLIAEDERHRGVTRGEVGAARQRGGEAQLEGERAEEETGG